MRVEPMVALFLRWCAQNREPATVRFYGGRLKRFRTKFGEREFGELTPTEIFEYLVDAGEGVSDSTRRHNAVALETLQSWAIDQKHVAVAIFSKLEKPRMGRREALPTEDDTQKLLANASPEFVTIYTALRLCGARPGELCGATLADWDRPAGVILLKKHKTARKTGQPRRIPVSTKLAALLLESTQGRTEGPLFLSPQGEAWARQNLSQTYSRLRNAAKLSKDLVLYSARHEAGTELCRAAGIEVARRVLGHSNLATTQRYVHLNDKELADACEKLGGQPPPPPAPPPATPDESAPQS